MKFTHDPQADAIYIELRDADVARTVELSENCIVDLDRAGNPVGVELLFVSQWLKRKDIRSQTFQLLSPGVSELTWKQISKGSDVSTAKKRGTARTRNSAKH